MSDLLFLAHRVPFPPDRGDKIRSFHILQHLAVRHRVHLVAFADDEADFDPPAVFTDMLESCVIVPRVKSQRRAAIESLLTGRPVSLTAFADPRVAAAIGRIRAEHPIAATYAFSGQMAQYLDDSHAVMDFVDMDSAKFAGLADDQRGPMRWMLRREAGMLGRFERMVAARVSASLFVSDAEAALFRRSGGQGRILTIENGIDTVAYDPAIVAAIPAPQPLIVFTGQMDYRPNVEAVCWFADAILPLVQARHPAALFAIVGRAPTAAVLALGDRDGVIVTGAVPDTRGWLAAASVCVAPLRLARGIQNKVLEAMAMARPVVVSATAAEGIDHDGTIRVADAAAGFADAVSALIDDPEGASALGAAARARVQARYGWAARLAPLDAVIGAAA